LGKNILVEIRTNKSKYAAGEEVKLSTTVTNKSSTPAELVFPSTQRYDFTVLREGKEVWRWSNDKTFAMILESLLLKPDEKQTYRETWKPKDAATGEYKAIGTVTSQPPHKTKCTFEIDS